MKHAGLALAALLLLSQSARIVSEDHPSIQLIGTYLGTELRPDGADPAMSPLHRTYYVRTDEGTWSLVSSSDIVDAVTRTLTTVPGHARNDRENLLDTLKRWQRFAFRAEPDRRSGTARNAFVVYIPRTDDPRKDDRFEAAFVPNPSHVPVAATNISLSCSGHATDVTEPAQYCGN